RQITRIVMISSTRPRAPKCTDSRALKAGRAHIGSQARLIRAHVPWDTIQCLMRHWLDRRMDSGAGSSALDPGAELRSIALRTRRGDDATTGVSHGGERRGGEGGEARPPRSLERIPHRTLAPGLALAPARRPGADPEVAEARRRLAGLPPRQ